jgi:hypothetical protein
MAAPCVPLTRTVGFSARRRPDRCPKGILVRGLRLCPRRQNRGRIPIRAATSLLRRASGPAGAVGGVGGAVHWRESVVAPARRTRLGRGPQAVQGWRRAARGPWYSGDLAGNRLGSPVHFLGRRYPWVPPKCLF